MRDWFILEYVIHNVCHVMCHIYCTASLCYAFIPQISLNYTGNADKFIDKIKNKQTD